MTKEQIEMLRGLIQQEVELGIAENEGGLSAFERQQMLDGYWKQFAESFNTTPTEPLEIDA